MKFLIAIILTVFLLACCGQPTCIVSGRYAGSPKIYTFEVVLEGDKDKFCEGVPLLFDFEVVNECYCK
jgi:hypothetical protein